MSTPLQQASAAESPSTVSEPDDSQWRSLDPRSVTADRVANWIFSAVLIIALLIGGGITYWINRPAGPITNSILASLFVLIVVGAVIGHVHPGLAYRHTRYRLSTLGFEIQRGICWRTRITVPISRVQHTDVAQGPMQRWWSLGKLVVYTAGTQYAAVELEGLAFDVAGQLRDALVAQRESLDGV